MFNESENQLIATLGVYGCWLLKNGNELPKDNDLVKNLISVYSMYYRHADHPTAGVLMGCIDAVARDLIKFPVFGDYDSALVDLIEYRGTLK